MAKCRICGEQFFKQTSMDPEEPCVCSHGIFYDSPWQYAGFKGVKAWFRYTVLRKLYEKMTCNKVVDWLYEPWDY